LWRLKAPSTFPFAGPKPLPFQRVQLFRRDVHGVDQRVVLDTKANPRDEGDGFFTDPAGSFITLTIE